MSEIVERVARAMATAEPFLVGQKIKTTVRADDWERFIPQARAAIEAMRYPDAGQMTAGVALKREFGDNVLNRLNASAVFNAMIDAALAPQT